MSNRIKVSVVVPVYNQELFIGRCLRSLLDQTLDKDSYEIIVINDCSKDNSMIILDKFKGKIKLLSNKKNMGLPYSLNKGIKSSQGRFIVRVDSDDYVNKEFLNFLQMYLLYNPKMDSVCCDYYLVDDKENIIKQMDSSKDPIGCGIMFRVETLINIGLYDKSFKVHEDKDLRIRFLKNYNINKISLPLYRYRRHSKNITKNKKKMKLHYKKLLKKHS